MEIKECECCNTMVQIEDNDPDIILEPFPHVQCPECGWWIKKKKKKGEYE